MSHVATGEIARRTIRDGIVYESFYWKESVRTAFILEALPFTQDDELEKLTNWLYDWSQSKEKSYDVENPYLRLNPELEDISRFIMLMKNRNISYTQCGDFQSLRKNLARTAIFYLEKNEEYYSARYDEDSYAEGPDPLTKEVRDRSDEIIGQLHYANPMIVFCCNTFHHVIEDIFNLSTNVAELPCGASYLFHNGTTYVEFTSLGRYDVKPQIIFAYFKEVLKDVLFLIKKQENSISNLYSFI